VREILAALRETWESEWQAPGTAAFLVASGGFALLALVAARSEQGWVPILDSANLVFHEAGHPIFGLFGDLAQVLGGTLMQLVVPLTALVAFWWRRQAGAVFVTGVWFFENWLNVARYMADARAQLLPLVGGGEHDWNTLFARWGVLRHDTAIAGSVRFLGWMGMLACWCWLAWRWHLARAAVARR
jgi:hypothetical protein